MDWNLGNSEPKEVFAPILCFLQILLHNKEIMWELQEQGRRKESSEEEGKLYVKLAQGESWSVLDPRTGNQFELEHRCG